MGREASCEPVLVLVMKVACACADPLDEEALRRMHPLQALLQTLLPWVNAGQAPDYGAQEEGAGGQDAAAPHGASEQVQNGGGAPDGADADYADYAFESDDDEPLP